jgi:hypothetical protein
LDDLLHKVRFTRGVHSVVCVGCDPAPVDDGVIDIITAHLDEAGFVKLGARLEIGAKVLIQAGTFKGLTGIFEREAVATDRIKISTPIFSTYRRVKPHEWIRSSDYCWKLLGKRWKTLGNYPRACDRSLETIPETRFPPQASLRAPASQSN